MSFHRVKKSIYLLLCVLAFPLSGKTAKLSPKVSLGEKLFFDKRMSSDQKISCASCHKPELAFTNGQALATGVHGRIGDRNVPTLINRKGTGKQFWDMRASSLADQTHMVLTDHNEMGNDIEKLLVRLRAQPEYQNLFQKVFGRSPDLAGISEALVAFQETLNSGVAPYDRFMDGDKKALTALQQRGQRLFFDKFKCVSCHSGPNFSDEKLNVRCYPFAEGIKAVPTQKFKTPTLRNLIYTGPYMHNGSLKTLEAAVDFYNPSQHLDDHGRPVENQPPIFISKEENKALVSFLKSLSADKPFVQNEAP